VGGVPEFLVVIAIVAVALSVIWPAARICQRVGFCSWLGVLAVIPIANLLLLWFVALAEWPLSEPPRDKA
jgi:hypothetical protein